MNLVQLAEHAKNLSNEQLQKMLQQPDGSVPPFILASEAARRQDIEQSAQMQPSQPTTVLDDLIKGRADKAGVAQLAGQMAQPQQAAQPQMARGGGLMSLANGGQVRGFAGGSVAVARPYQSTSPSMPTLSEIGAGLGQTWNNVVDWGSKTYDIVSSPQEVGMRGATDPFVRQNAGLSASVPSAGTSMTAAENEQDLAQYRRMADFSPAAPKTSSPGPNTIDPKVLEKLKETAEKEQEMGVEVPSTVATPTTGNSNDSAGMRARFAELFSGEDNEYFLGIAPTGFAAASQAMFENDPGTSTGERIANAAMALAASQQSAEEDRQERAREGAMALLNYDMRVADQAREDELRQMGWNREDERYRQERELEAAKDRRAENSAKAASYLEGVKTQSETYKVMADRIGKDMENIADKYQGNPLGIKAWTPDDINRYKELESAQKSYYAQYIYFQNELSGARGVKTRVSETIDQATGRPIPIP